ncbi:MAG: hydrogenase small subunit [Bacillota bacterium]
MGTTNLETGLLKLELRGVSRRDFLKYCSATAMMLGMNYCFGGLLAQAATTAVKKKPVIWIQGQGCTGCSCSLLSSMSPGPAEILLDAISMRFNSTIMNSAGHVSTEVLKSSMQEGDYLLVVEGSIPTADPRFCMVEGMPFDELLMKAAKNASAVIAAGTCAAYGGIPQAGITGAKSVSDLISDKPIINVPGCPLKPDWLVGTLLYYLTFGEVPALDAQKRPLAYFGRHFLHDSCARAAYFERGQFLEDWNDPSTSAWCLLKKGCKGPVTYADCNSVFWNDGANSCVKAGSPCAGCVQPEFYKELSPLYASPFAPGTEDEMLPLVKSQRGLDPASVALGVGIAAVPLVATQVEKLLKKNIKERAQNE